MSKRVAIVDYGMGNIRSVVNAFEYIGVKVILANKPTDLKKAEAVVVPGQGGFGDCMKSLQANKFVEALTEEVYRKKKPYLGVCLGMQILGQVSSEGGKFAGLGWVKGRVRKISAAGNLKVPHLGWNEVRIKRRTALFRGITNNACFYFAHSYALYPDNRQTVVATTNYGGTVTAAIKQDNIEAVQFHPEKSQQRGLDILKNFIHG